MTKLPMEEPESGPSEYKIIPEGTHTVLVTDAVKVQDKKDLVGIRELVILTVKPRQYEDTYKLFLRVPIHWTKDGTTETEISAKIGGAHLAAMLKAYNLYSPGDDLDMSRLIGKSYEIVIKHAKGKKPSPETGQIKTYANIQKISLPPAEPATEAPQNIPNSDLPF